MKTTNQLFKAAIMLCLLFSFAFTSAQESKAPAYVVATQLHWNMDYEDFDMDTWKAVEKEYHDKVTMKNEHIMGASMYMHRFTPDNTELMAVRTYATWDAIDKAGDRDEELAKAAWPDEIQRKAFFKKKNAYYSADHSDEIYAPMAGAKPIGEVAADKEMILYLRKSHFAFPEDGTSAEFDAVTKEYIENVFHKNEYIKGYYPNAHAWGSDRTEYIEAFFVDSVADLEKMLDKNGELYKAHWPDEAKRKAEGKIAGKYFTGVHGDYIYTMISGLSK